MIIVVDTSALVAVIFDEDDAEELALIMAGAEPVVSAGSLIELIRVVTLRSGPAMRAEVTDLLGRFEIRVEPVDVAQVELAAEGHARFGTGRGKPPAVLNFGDLFAYALARHLDAPLLFKGNDFGQTDVKVALPATP